MAKSFRRTPPEIDKKIRGFKSKSAVVGCATGLSEKDVRDGVYEHLGIGLDKGKLSFPVTVLYQTPRLSGPREGKDFFRVVHCKGWKTQVRELNEQKP